MRIRKTLVTAGAVLAMVAWAPAGVASAAPERSGCQAFGANVATLATTPGLDFGATASTVAGLFPQAFPTIVVRSEQSALCG
jgi:hypothetical protein